MKRRLLPLLFALLLILPACAASADGITLTIEASTTQTYMGETSATEYFCDSVRILENGFYEVQGGKIEDGVDRVEDTTIYFTDGAQETVYLTDGVISRTVRREANGAVSELLLTPHGLLEEMFLFDPGEPVFFLHVRTEYTELNVSDYLDK